VSTPVLGRDDLNRATLARQMLLRDQEAEAERLLRLIEPEAKAYAVAHADA